MDRRTLWTIAHRVTKESDETQWLNNNRFQLQLATSLGMGHRLSNPVVCGILVPWPGIEPTYPTLKGEFLPLDHQGSPQSTLFCKASLWTTEQRWCPISLRWLWLWKISPLHHHERPPMLEGHWPTVSTDQIPVVPTRPHLCCVTLGMSLSLSGPPLPHLLSEEIELRWFWLF